MKISSLTYLYNINFEALGTAPTSSMPIPLDVNDISSLFIVYLQAQVNYYFLRMLGEKPILTIIILHTFVYIAL
jgi:hypothetical protein